MSIEERRYPFVLFRLPWDLRLSLEVLHYSLILTRFHTKEPVPWKNEAGSAHQKEGHGEACLEIWSAEERIYRLHMYNWENMLIFCLPFWLPIETGAKPKLIKDFRINLLVISENANGRQCLQVWLQATQLKKGKEYFLERKEKLGQVNNGNFVHMSWFIYIIGY